MVFAGEQLLVRTLHHDEEADAPHYALLTSADLTARFPGTDAKGLFLFSIDDTSYYFFDYAALSEIDDLPADCLLLTVRKLRSEGHCERHVSFAAFTALHLCRWYQENRYCGSCGTKTLPAIQERALDCPSCNRRLYPRIAPAVIVGVTNGDEILLTRYANRYHAFHALVAGYNEIGETLEDTVHREVMEEVGLRVKNIRYYKSQPWG
ncbi:MAG: NUDIX domain-containing protein, partial [Lachnospiraceae bacterium]|nr:NUDIX domain-containing protein [Lachnospiraceae bacterium]